MQIPIIPIWMQDGSLQCVCCYRDLGPDIPFKANFPMPGLYNTRLESRIGDTDFKNPTLTNLLNLALTVGVVIPVSREISRNDFRPSLNNDLRIETS